MQFIKKPFRWAILYFSALLTLTIYILLDTFVIPKPIAVVAQHTTTSNQTIIQTTASSEQSETTTNIEASNSTSTSEPVITATSYESDTLNIQISTLYEYDTTIYVAEIITSDVSTLKTAFASDTFGRNIKALTSTIAENNDAILAVNGDFYGFRDDGAVLRNGVLYRSTVRQGDITEALVIDNDGVFSIIDETETDISTMDTSNIAQIISFGPALVNNGEIVVDSSDEVDTKSNSLLNPRSAIAMIEPGHYLIVVADGRTSESAGLSLAQLAQVMKNLGATVAYNLDGGGSSTLVFNGQVINNPTTNGNSSKEREVSDIVYFGL